MTSKLPLPVTDPAHSPRVRLLYLNYEWDRRESSGASTHMRELTRELRALGHTVIPCDRHRKPDASTRDDHEGRGNESRGFGWRRLLSPYLHESAALLRSLQGVAVETALIRREKPDVVLTRYSLHQFSSLVAGRRCGVPVVFEVNAPAGFEYRRYRGRYKLFPQVAEWREVRNLSRADAVFVVSAALKQHFVERGISADRIAVIPNGADTLRFRPEVADPWVRQRLGCDSIVIGFVGSFAQFHGVELLRKTIDLASERRPRARFLLVGSGELSAKLESYCRSRGLEDRVVFTGYVAPERVPGLMAGMDILLAPYQAEELFYLSPIKIFEYMASGRAVLAARVGQIAEVIEDGVNGFLYEPATPESLATQLLRLIDDAVLRERLGKKARETVERRYTWRANAKAVVALLRRAVDANRSGNH